jgi:aminoglycoside phosphotransferase (APT) family kinase protein
MAGATGEAEVRVEGLRRLSGGASRETWAFDLVHPGGTSKPLILRRDPPGAPRAGGMGVEAAVVRAAAAAGVPVPRVVTTSDDVDLIGAAFMVVERIDGETIPRRILREPALAPARPRLAEQCGRILAAIHSVRPGEVPGLERHDALAQYRETLDQIGWPSPTFELAFRWLEQHRPAPADAAGPRVVHGDFRNGNLIVGPDGVRAVLDWEMAHLGDPMEDLAWLCVKSWRFGVDRPVGGFGTYEQLIGAYEAAGGAPVDRDALRWWEILGNLKWGVICMMQAWAHTSGAVRSVELAAIGRRVGETEWDLLELLSPPAGGVEEEVRAGTPAPGPVDMHGVPDAAGLVEAVREFLERDVMAATEGRVRFHARVAVNVLGMVERELSLGPAQRAAHAAGLAALGVGGEAELAAAIRAGRMDGRRDEVTSLLRRTVRAKLEVAHPSYLEPPAPPVEP